MRLLYIKLKQPIVTKIIISFILFLITFTIITVQLSSAFAFHQVTTRDLLTASEEFTRCQDLDDHETIYDIPNGILTCREIDTSANETSEDASEGSSGRPVLGVIPVPDGFPTNPSDIIASAVTVLLGFAGLIFFMVLLLGGLRYLTAGGDEKATMAARQTLTNAFIGLVIVVASFLIAQILFAVFGLDALVNVI